MITIKSNPKDLTDFETNAIKLQEWYVYTYGVGMIFMKDLVWDCTDTVGAKKHLDNLGIEEKINPPSNEQKKRGDTSEVA